MLRPTDRRGPAGRSLPRLRALPGGRPVTDDASLPAVPGIPGMPDLGGIMESFQKVQEARSQIYEGRAGGGAVVVRGAGDLSFESITIRPDVVDPDDVEMLQDLVLAALH